jgi:nicotinate-nucleotide adenylyltransferase
MIPKTKKHIGLFFGSFNPMHVGHLMIANYMLEFEQPEAIWFVVSPHNPFKTKEGLLNASSRLKMTQLAVAHYDHFEACDIEFSLPQPSYSIDTLQKLQEQHPEFIFHLIMGSDNLLDIGKWKEANTIVNNYHKLVYPRPGYPVDKANLIPNTQLTDAPLVDISSTQIRKWLSQNKNVDTFLPPEVAEYVRMHHPYS